MILSEYSGAYIAYSLRRLNNTNEPYPLIRVSREEESYSVECDVYADSNQTISFESPVFGNPLETSATTLGEFLNIQHDNVDNLSQANNAKIVKLYDQANDNDYIIVATNEAFTLVEGGTILTINNKPAFRVNPITDTTDTLVIQNSTELSLHYVANSLSSNSYLGFKESDKVLGYLTGSKEFESNALLSINLNLVSRGLDEADVSVNPALFDSVTATPSLFTVEFKRQIAYISKLEFADTALFSEVILYPNYSNQRRYYIENDQAEYYSLAADNLLDTITPNSFINTFGTPAAAYSVRSLRGLTGVNGPKILRVRRDVDNIEVDVYTDNSGWVSLDSPIENVYETTINTVNREYISLATTLGEFVADPSYNNPDNITTTTATVSAWYDQSKVDTNLLPLQISNDEAAAAYSVRLINPEYNGPLLKIRRTSDNVTKDIYPNDNGELDTDAIEQFIQEGVMGPNYTEQYLLDIIPDGETEAPPAAAAYSLRKLREGYTGALVRVRRTDGIEVDVYPQEEDGWFGLESPIENLVESPAEEGDFDGTLTFKYYAQGDNVTVVTWYDQSLNENHAIQEATGNQPKIYDSSTGVVMENGKPAASFNDIAYLRIGVAFPEPFTMASVHVNAIDQTEYVMGAIDKPSFAYTNGRPFLVGNASYLGTTLTSSQQRLRLDRYSSVLGVVNINIDGSVNGNHTGVTTYTASAGSSLGSYWTNGGGPLANTMQEFVFWSSYQDDSTKTGIESNINNAFSIYGGWEATVETWYDQSKAYTPNTTNLLDTTYGGGAAAAYSLRRLSTDTTSLVTIRREYDSLEATVEADSNGEISLLSPINNLSENEVRLLDKYPNAAAAYSLRRLNTAYTGNGIEAVGVDTSTNTQYGANLPITFNTTGAININPFVQVLQIYYGQNSNVTELRIRTWYDQSGNNNHAVQTDVTKMPVIARVIDGVATLITDANGKPAVEFDGTDDYLQTSYSNANNYTAFYVQTPVNSVGGVLVGRGDSTSRHVFGWSNSNSIFLYRGGSTAINASGTTSQYLGYVLSQPASSNCRVGYNGTTGTTSSTIGTGELANMVLGAERAGLTQYGQSNAQEIIIYEGDQSGNRGGIEAHINSFYNIYGITDTAATNLGEFVAATGFNNPDNITATSARVVQWWDQSGNDNHALQYVSLSQPTLVDNGVLIKENGKPALQYDGANNSLQSGAVSFAQPNTWFFVATGSNTNDFYLDGGSASESRIAIYSSTTLNMRAGNTFLATVGDGFIGNQSLIYALFNGASSKINWHNGTEQTGNAGTNAITGITLGSDGVGGNNLTGKAQEYILYNSDNTGNRTDIESNINSHYRIYDYNDASQSDTNAQPAIASGGVVIRENGKPAIGDWISAQTILIASFGQTYNTVNIYSVSTENQGSSVGYIVNGNTSTGFRLARNGQGADIWLYDGAISKTTSAESAGQALVSVLNGVNPVGYFNGVSRTFDNTLNGNGMSGAYIGNHPTLSAGGNLDGNLQELIIYPSNQSTNRPLIEKSINSYYNIYAQDAAIQNVATAQPTIYNGGLITENGRAILWFNDDYFVSSSWMTSSSPLSFLLTYKQTSSTGRDLLIGVDTLTPYTTSFQAWSDAGFKAFDIPADYNFQIFPTPQYYLISSYASTTQMSAYINATQDPNGTISHSNTSAVSDAITIGSPTSYNPLNGLVSEFIAYLSDQSENRIDIENNINSAFQIYAANFSSVLDTVPSAKAAYSIRRLTKNYIGPIITVSNGSTTKDFYADFWGNLDVDALTSFANGGTLSVTKWWDQSGNNYHLLGEYTNKPTLNTTNGDLSVDTTNNFTLPLLDRYSGAAAAYSLRELSSSYTGPLVRVRRDGTNTEVDVYPDANGELSLDSPVSDVAESTTDVTANPADTLATKLGEFVAATGYSNPDSLGAAVSAFVVVWFDQSGNGRNATQTTASLQRTVYKDATGNPAGLVTLNGKPATYHNATGGAYIHSFPAYATWSTFDVAHIDQYPFGVHSTTSGSWAYLADGATNTPSYTTFDEATIYNKGQLLNVTSRPDLLAALSTADDVLISFFGTLNNNSTSFYLGSAYLENTTYNVRGYLQESILYDSDQSSNRTGIEKNINDYYQIPNFNSTAPTSQSIAVYSDAINESIDLNGNYTNLKEIIIYE